MPTNISWYLGISIEDKQLNSRELKVYLRELTPFASGKLADNTRTESFSVTNASGEKESGNVNTTNGITADYFGMFTNRTTPPDVVKGEHVLVIQYADEDKYYWIALGRDDNLRKTELVKLAASNDRAESKTLTDNNTYFVEIDTKLGKRIRIQTSKSDGEPFSYNLVLDAANSFIQLADDKGNRVEIISNEKQVKLANENGTTVDLKGNDISILAPGDITLRAGGTLNLVAGTTNMNTAIENTGTFTNKGDMNNDGNITTSGTITASGAVTAPNIPH